MKKIYLILILLIPLNLSGQAVFGDKREVAEEKMEQDGYHEIHNGMHNTDIYKRGPYEAILTYKNDVVLVLTLIYPLSEVDKQVSGLNEDFYKIEGEQRWVGEYVECELFIDEKAYFVISPID